jgi:hypothetical protein
MGEMGRRALFIAALATFCVPAAADGNREPDFVAVARAGARPRECGGAARETPTRWDRARIPELGRYCDALARGYGLLRSSPRAAIEAADVAEHALPGRGAATVLVARAKLSLGDDAGAWSAFERVRSASPRDLEAVATLHDLAVAALRTGHREEAFDAYRALVPRVALLDEATEEVRVLVEAGVLSMSFGPERLAEAIAYLAEARRRSKAFGENDYVLSALALAESRDGRTAEATAVADEASGPWWLESQRDAAPASSAERPVLPPAELDAMIATLAARHDAELARSRWESYLSGDGGKGPFAAHARTQRAAVPTGGKRRKSP